MYIVRVEAKFSYLLLDHLGGQTDTRKAVRMERFTRPTSTVTVNYMVAKTNGSMVLYLSLYYNYNSDLKRVKRMPELFQKSATSEVVTKFTPGIKARRQYSHRK